MYKFKWHVFVNSIINIIYFPCCHIIYYYSLLFPFLCFYFMLITGISIHSLNWLAHSCCSRAGAHLSCQRVSGDVHPEKVFKGFHSSCPTEEESRIPEENIQSHGENNWNISLETSWSLLFSSVLHICHT